jgi:hypothetical protein
MARTVTEWDLQHAFCLYFGGEKWAAGPLVGQWKVEPAQLPGVVWWHTPNGGHRDVREGVRLKQIGVLAGVHDLLFLWGGLYGMEWKVPDGRPAERQLSTAQRAMHPRLLRAGMVASVTVDSLESAKQAVRAWGLVAAGH